MSDDEVVDEVTSQELEVDEMIQHFEEKVKDEHVENPKRYDAECKGNIFTECIQDGLRELDRASRSTDLKYTVIGGIGTQLRGLADCKDIIKIADKFGRRQTADIDILVENYADSLSLLQEYDAEGKPTVDIVYGHVPGDQEIIADSEYVDFSSIEEDFDFELPIPTNEDLVYSKVWHPSLEKKEGTHYDLEMYSENAGYIFDLDENKLEETIKIRAPNLQASMDYLERSGLGI